MGASDLAYQALRHARGGCQSSHLHRQPSRLGNNRRRAPRRRRRRQERVLGNRAHARQPHEILRACFWSYRLDHQRASTGARLASVLKKSIIHIRCITSISRSRGSSCAWLIWTSPRLEPPTARPSCCSTARGFYCRSLSFPVLARARAPPTLPGSTLPHSA
jgi:hypothetical protein